MAIYAYTGIPGSGKSYEVVSSVIVENFKKGRTIVTNIEGISEDKLIDYCLSDVKLTREQLGTLLKVTDSDCQRDDFFPYKGSTDTICKAGDLICIDEVWRIFPSDKIHPNHRSFIAEHRHFTNDKGDCCDLVVINQSISGVPRFIKDRVETTFVMKKMSMLGLNKRYRVDVFVGAKVNKASMVTQYHNKYNPDIFNLYKSFDGINGKQNVIDDRQNVFKSGKFKLIMLLGLLGLSLGAYALYYMIDKVQSKYKKEPVQEIAQAPSSDELKPIQPTTVKSPETCIKLISMKKTENGNVYVIKKGQHYETTTILHLAHVCNNAKFKG